MLRVTFSVQEETASWNRLRVIRQFLGLTISELAKRCGVGATSIVIIESGADFKVSLKLRNKVFDGLLEVLEERSIKILHKDLYPTQMLGSKPDPAYFGKETVRVQLQAFQEK